MKPDSHDFLVKTNNELDAWMKTFYIPEAIPSIVNYSRWAWQEQERRFNKLIAELNEHQRVDLGNAARQSYDGLMERIAPLVAAIEAVIGRRTDSLEVEAIQKELDAALTEFKEPK